MLIEDDVTGNLLLQDDYEFSFNTKFELHIKNIKTRAEFTGRNKYRTKTSTGLIGRGVQVTEKFLRAIFHQIFYLPIAFFINNFMIQHKIPIKDLSIINVNDDEELNWWAEHFEINKDKIKEAVDRVGPSIEAVRRYLQK